MLQVVKVYEIFDHMYNNENEAKEIEKEWFPKDHVKTRYIVLDQQELNFFLKEQQGVMASVYSYDTEQQAQQAILNDEY